MIGLLIMLVVLLVVFAPNHEEYEERDTYREEPRYSRAYEQRQERRNTDMIYDRDREIQEAIRAGENALRSLESAKRELDSASNWGIFDMFTRGGFIGNMMKHDRLNKAQNEIRIAQQELAHFARELSDVQELERLDINIGGFETFADFFFDNIFVDYMIQTKINDAKRQVEDAIYRVDRMLDRLYQLV